MDIVTLAMAKAYSDSKGVNVVNLNDYLTTTNLMGETLSLGAACFMAIGYSVTNGGVLQTAEYTMVDSAFRQACSGDNQLILTIVSGGETILLPVSVDKYNNGKVVQTSCSLLMGMADVGVINSNVLIWFKSDTTLTLYVKATPITA